MSSIKKNIKEILEETAKQEGLEEEYSKQSYTRWTSLIKTWLKNSKKYNTFKNILFIVQIFIGGISIVLGFLVKDIQSTFLAVSIWAVYAIINIFVNLVYRFYPDDYEKFVKDVKIIKLIAFSERLAAKLALFEKFTKHDVVDDRNTIEQISFRIKDYAEMNFENQAVIKKCIDPRSRFSSSRDTNIILSMDDYELTDNEKIELNHITRELSEAAQILFGGRGYSIKLYLRVIKKVKTENVEMLVPFSRFPTKENFGSTWIKSRGNLSSVWECLERGRKSVVDVSNQDLYYKSFVSICLPGRIGVLAIHNEENDIFEENVSEIDCKAIALLTKHLVMEVLEIYD